MADERGRARSRRRRLNGEGTISGPRKDGRYVGAFYTRTTTGTIKRVYVYGKTWEQAHDRMVEDNPGRSAVSLLPPSPGGSVPTWTTG
jgi:hypothetical protein